MDYYSELVPLSLLARKFSLVEKLAGIECARIAQADRKDYSKFVKEIERQIKQIDSELSEKRVTAENYQDNWADILNMAKMRGW